MLLFYVITNKDVLCVWMSQMVQNINITNVCATVLVNPRRVLVGRYLE